MGLIKVIQTADSPGPFPARNTMPSPSPPSFDMFLYLCLSFLLATIQLHPYNLSLPQHMLRLTLTSTSPSPHLSSRTSPFSRPPANLSFLSRGFTSSLPSISSRFYAYEYLWTLHPPRPCQHDTIVSRSPLEASRSCLSDRAFSLFQPTHTTLLFEFQALAAVSSAASTLSIYISKPKRPQSVPCTLRSLSSLVLS